MKSSAMLLGVSIAIISCKEAGYLRIDYSEVISTEINGQIESIVIDHSDRIKTILNINNKNGHRFRIPIFTRWVSESKVGSVSCQPVEGKYECYQHGERHGEAAAFDSVFKEKGGDMIKVKKDRAHEVLFLKIVHSDQAYDSSLKVTHDK